MNDITLAFNWEGLGMGTGGGRTVGMRREGWVRGQKGYRELGVGTYGGRDLLTKPLSHSYPVQYSASVSFTQVQWSVASDIPTKFMCTCTE